MLGTVVPHPGDSVGGDRGRARSGQDERGVVPVPPLELLLESVHHVEDVVPCLRDLALLAHQELDGCGQPLVVQCSRVGSRRRRRAARSGVGRGASPLRAGRPSRPRPWTAPGLPDRMVESRSTRLPPSPRCHDARPRRGGSRRVPGRGDEGADTPLGVALVATRPQVLQREVGEALDELRSPDPVDPSVAALFAHENRIVARRAARGGTGSTDGEQHLVRVDGRSPPGCHSKWRWLIEPALPVFPTYPITVPAPTPPLAELKPDRWA